MARRQVQSQRTGNCSLSYSAFSDNKDQPGHMEIVCVRGQKIAADITDERG